MAKKKISTLSLSLSTPSTSTSPARRLLSRAAERPGQDREDRGHVAFSTGAHTCLGNFLARAEMRIMAEEWMKRVPSFRLKPGTRPKWRTGGVAAMYDVFIEWPVEQ